MPIFYGHIARTDEQIMKIYSKVSELVAKHGKVPISHLIQIYGYKIEDIEEALKHLKYNEGIIQEFIGNTAFIMKKSTEIEDERFPIEKYMNRRKEFENKLTAIFNSNEYYIKDIKTYQGEENEHSKKGVYLLFHPDYKEPIYAGQAGKKERGNISRRMYDHYHTNGTNDLNIMIEKLGIIIKEDKSKFLEKCTIKYIEIEDPKERDDIESFLVIYLQPLLNYL